MINKNSILNKAIYNSLFCHAYIMLDSNNSVILNLQIQLLRSQFLNIKKTPKGLN